MEYGILFALGELGDWQLIGTVNSPTEARDMANWYLAAGPEAGLMAPESFAIYRRGAGGWYTIAEPLAMDTLNTHSLDAIAQHRLGLKTLETRNSDRLDFKELAIWNIKAALEDAYNMGKSQR